MGKIRQAMRIFNNSDIKAISVIFTVVLLITWLLPMGVLFADKNEEEILLEELTGESESAEGEESIEVLGFTEEDAPVLGNKFLIMVIVIIVAAVGGLLLSFVIRGRT